MLIPIHEAMTREALRAHVSPRALDSIVAANKAQDKLSNQFGHDEIHFDNNALAAGERYLREQRETLLVALRAGDVLSAWAAFGRLTHTAQDFYSHTNYVALWREKNPRRVPAEMDPLDPELLASPNLRSGRLYFPLDWLYFVPPLRRFVLPHLREDSHGRMNLDSPAQGEAFAYAREAAIRRTRRELEQLREATPPEWFHAFCDL